MRRLIDTLPGWAVMAALFVIPALSAAFGAAVVLLRQR